MEPYLTSWNRGGVKKCIHAFIGQRPDGSFGVVQTLPWEMRCWGCGSGIRGTYNRDHIQFELCQDDRSDPDWCKKCYDKAVELCAYLCRRYGFGAEAIVDHAEAHARGYASNHGDPDAWFPLHGRNMDSLRREVINVFLACLRDNGVTGKVLFEDSSIAVLAAQCTYSAEHMVRFASALFQRTLQYLMSSGDEDIMARAERYIRTHFMDNITREDVAAVACITPNYLSKQFHLSLIHI